MSLAAENSTLEQAQMPLHLRLLSAIDSVFVALAFALSVVFVLCWLLGFQLYAVTSGSMEPAIPTGSLAVVHTSFPYDELRVGDVITYQAPAVGVVMHRIVAVGSEGLVTQGDANDVTDGVSTTRANYLGRVVVSVPVLGFPTVSAQSPFGLISAIAFAVACLFAHTMIRDAVHRYERTGHLKEGPSS